MIRLMLSVLLLATSISVLAKESFAMNTSTSNQSQDQKAAELVVREYMASLRSSDTDSIMNLYADDAVFLPADAPTAVGKEKIRESYLTNFKIMSIPQAESVLEEATVHGDIAIVRLATKSTVLFLANQQKIELNARELFILTKVNGTFKISRYMFNKS